MRKTHVLAFTLLFSLGIQTLPSQVSATRSETAEVGFSEVSDKFIRNMKLLATLMQEPESQKTMNAVIGQATDLAGLYRSKNAGARREDMLKRKDMMSERESLKDSDQKRLQKIQDELRKLDPEDDFGKGKSQVMQTVGELQKQLGLIYTNDSDQKDLIRIIRQHLSFYSSSLGKLN
jgi:hypothetical protein